MLTNCTDTLSREATVDAHNVSISAGTWAAALALSRAHNIPLALILFADAPNAKLPRFCSLLPTTGAEGVDAFTWTTWGPFTCKVCSTTRFERLAK